MAIASTSCGWLAVESPPSSPPRWPRSFRRSKPEIEPPPPTTPPGAALPPRLLAIWRQRPDLQSAFDLGLTEGRAGLFWWYLLHGFGELGLKGDEDDALLSRSVNLPLEPTTPADAIAVTWLMGEFHRRSGERFAPLATDEGRRAFTAWFFATALTDRRLGAFLTEEQADVLRYPSPDRPGLPRIATFILDCDEALRARFAGRGDEAVLLWCQDEGARDYPILAHPLVALAKPWHRRARAFGRFGVNLIGHAYHRSGLSEDVRAAVLSLEQAGVPFAIHDASAGGAISNEDMTLASRVTTNLPFDLNLFCLTGMATVTTAMADAGISRDRRFSIGMWPWELPEWPTFWQHAYDHVDEVWAASRFTYDAYCRSAPVPVRHMPMAVSVEASDGAGRADFALPHDRFLFLFAFDGLSSFNRKNPVGCIAAFQAAFPERDAPVGLVVKGLRARNERDWADLLAAVGDDPRIHTVTESLPRGKVLDLYRSIDCFVSLHRSEGFGRNIAEAMLLGKPVITSAHSGNMDFTQSDTAALVPVRLVPLADGAYPFGDGQMWGEPDLKAAARQMRRMVRDGAWRETITQAGRATIADRYAPAVVGKRWADVLHAHVASRSSDATTWQADVVP